MLGGGNMLFDHGSLPFNMGQMMRWPANNTAYDDIYNTTNSNFSINLPATQATSYMMLIAYAKKDGVYYRDIFNLSAEGQVFSDAEHDFSMQELISGVPYEINANNVSNQWNETNVLNSTAVEFRFVDSNSTLLDNENPFVEMKMSTNGIEYMKMTDAQSGVFEVPMTNGEDIVKLTIYSQSYAPISTPVNGAVINGSENTSNIVCGGGQCNITMVEFGDFDPFGENKTIGIRFFKSNATCDVPQPPDNCNIMGNGSMDKTEFSPLKAILLGDLSLRITSGNISVHYVTTDLLASGPPDAAFSENSTGSDMEAAWKFGTQGPEIYSRVILGMPYSDSLENETIVVTIPVLYDIEFNAIWNSSDGDTVADIATDDSLADYLDYLDTEYEVYLNGTGVECSEEDSDLSEGLCYKDASNQMIWIKIPHFSGVGTVVGMLNLSDATLYIWDETDAGEPWGDQIREVCDQVSFFANYTNTTSNESINNTLGNCTISFADAPNGPFDMNWSGSIWAYNRSFSEINSSNWNVTCNSTEYQTMQATDTVNITDVTAPVVNMLTANTNTSDSTTAISFNYTDVYSETANCSLYFNGSSVANNATVTNNTNTVLTSIAQADGTYTVYVNCTDESGNLNKSGEISVMIDATAPAIPASDLTILANLTTYNISSSPNITVANGIINISWNTSDENLVVTNLSIDDGVITNSSSTSGFNWFSTTLDAGLHWIVFAAADVVDNSVTTSAYSFRIIRQENVTQLMEELVNNSGGNITGAVLTNSTGGVVTGTEWINETYNLTINTSQTNVSVVIVNFTGIDANWNITNFTVDTNASSATGEDIASNSGVNVTKMALFVGAGDFLSAEDFGNGAKIIFEEDLSGFTLLYISDDIGERIYKIANVCPNGAAGPSSFPVTTSNMCYNITNSTANRTTIWIPHLSGAGGGVDEAPPVITVNNPADDSELTEGYFTYKITVNEANPNATTFCWFVFSGTNENSTLTTSNFTNDNTTTYNFTYVIGNLTDGEYNITTHCQDNFTNSEEIFINFTIEDNSVPSVTFSTPSVTNSTADIAITASSYDPVNYTLYSNSTDINTSVSSSYLASHTISLTGLADSTTYHYNISACDVNGNCNTTEWLNFTTEELDEGGDGDGDGDGDGTASGTSTGNTTSQLWLEVYAGETNTMTITKADFGLSSIVFATNKDLTNVRLRVETRGSNPTTVAVPAVMVYKYLSFTPSGMTDADINSASINFKIARSWMISNKVSPDTVALYRYTNGAWSKLSTTATASDSSYYNYKATTPGFSYFAIGGEVSAGEEEGDLGEEDAGEEEAVCGNNIKEKGEECDGTDVAGKTCKSQGFDSGSLGCSDACTLDTSNCVKKADLAGAATGALPKNQVWTLVILVIIAVVIVVLFWMNYRVKGGPKQPEHHEGHHPDHHRY